ncbi:hypothetical protein R3P38DRAFT_3049202 [Favolaschia claudopus]|uniref:F-box domain-containing protein n=1 Tax=Favolaschia claudopus TaxID=2862362 RepID=A0AAW0A5K9_9AGAR
MNPSANAQMSPESPFKSQINTNYIPTDPEISQIRAHLLPHEAELARLDALIQDLCAQRDRVKDYVDSHKALISHPRRLPQDILEEIFLACLPTAHNAVMSLSEPPLLLGRICSRWRSVAFALPRLWSSLHVHVDYVQWHEERVAAIDQWLKRASPVPLSIYVHGRDGPGSFDDAVVDILTGLSSYWCTLHLSKLTNEAVSSLAAENAPALSDIKVHFRDDFEEDEESPFLASRFLLGKNQPCISVVTVDPPSFVPMTPFTWSHITDLSLERADSSHSYHDAEEGYFDMATAHRLIEGCPRLRSLKVPISVGVSGPEMEPLMVSSLEMLSIDNNSTTSAVFEHFIDNLIMPQLTKLHLVNSDRYSSSDPVEPSVFERLTERSPLISEIALNLSSCLSTVDVLSGLEQLAHLSKISIILWTPSDGHVYMSNPDPDEDILFAILAPDSPSNPVPGLEDLSLETQFILEETWTEFIREHINHSTALRRLHLKLWVDSFDDVPAAPDLAEFIDTGLIVSVDYEVDENSFEATPWGGIDREE